MILKDFKLPAWILSPFFLVLFALLIRILYLLSLGNDPWLFYPTVDEIAYHGTAVAINETGQLTIPFFRPPLWPIIISALYQISGPHFFAVRILNIFIASISIFSCFRFTKRLFNTTIAYYSSLLFALTGLYLHINTTGLDTNLFILLILESSVFLHDYFKNGKRHNLIISALFIGIASLLRPVTILTILFYSLYLFLKLKGKKGISFAVIYLFIALIPVLPFTVANYINGENTILSTNGGINFYLGNNPTADGFSPTHPELGPGWTIEESKRFAVGKSNKTLTSSEVSTWYYNRTINTIYDNPINYIKLLLKKTALTLGALDISNNGDLSWFSSNRIFLRVLNVFGFYIFIPLGIVGIILYAKRFNEIVLPILAIISLLIPSILFFVTARFRLPILPFLLPFVIITVMFIFDKSKALKERIKYILISVSILLVCFLFSYVFGPKSNYAYGEFLQGQLYTKSGNKNQAIESFKTTLDLNPRAPLANYSIGKIFYSDSKYDSAALYFRKELNLHPRIKTFQYLAQSKRKMGLHEEAALVWLEASEVFDDKDDFFSLAALEYNEAAISSSEDGNWNKSILLFEKAHSLEPFNPYHRYGIACTKWMLGKKQEANDLIDSISIEHPDFTPALQWKTDGWRPE